MPRSEVNGLNLLVALDLFRRAFGEDAPVVHHRYIGRNAQGHVEIVLDDDVADIGWQRVEYGDEIASLRRRQTRGRLVEQDESRRAGQRQRDLELALLAVAQDRDRGLQDVVEMNGVSDRSRLRHRGVAVRRTQQRKPASGNASTSDEDAVDDGQAAEQLTDLIGASQPAPNSFMHGKVGDVFAEEPYPPRCGGKVSGNRVEESRLPRAVRAENGPPLAGGNPKVDVGERDKRPKHAPHAFQLQRMGAVGGEALGGLVGGHDDLSRYGSLLPVLTGRGRGWGSPGRGREPERFAEAECAPPPTPSPQGREGNPRPTCSPDCRGWRPR